MLAPVVQIHVPVSQNQRATAPKKKKKKKRSKKESQSDDQNQAKSRLSINFSNFVERSLPGRGSRRTCQRAEQRMDGWQTRVHRTSRIFLDVSARTASTCRARARCSRCPSHRMRSADKGYHVMRGKLIPSAMGRSCVLSRSRIRPNMCILAARDASRSGTLARVVQEAPSRSPSSIVYNLTTISGEWFSEIFRFLLHFSIILSSLSPMLTINIKRRRNVFRVCNILMLELWKVWRCVCWNENFYVTNRTILTTSLVR